MNLAVRNKWAFSKTLDISTAHVCDKDRDVLSTVTVTNDEATDRRSLGKIPVRVAPHQYGWVVFVPARPEDGGEKLSLEAFHGAGLSDAFFRVVEYAQRAGARIINFDRDAATLVGFTIFEW